MKIRNLGPIENGDFKLGNGTFFIGNNGTGKTIISNLIFGIQRFISTLDIQVIEDNEIKQLLRNRRITISFDDLYERIISFIDVSITNHMTLILENTFRGMSINYDGSVVTLSKHDVESLWMSKGMFVAQFDISNYRWSISKLEDLNNSSAVIIIKTVESLLEIDFLISGLTISEILNYTKNQVEIEELYFNSLDLDVINYDNDGKLKERLLRNLSSNITIDSSELMYYPSERAGFNVLKDELFYQRIQRHKLEDFEIISESNQNEVQYNRNSTLRYPMAVEYFIDMLSKKEYLDKNNAEKSLVDPSNLVIAFNDRVLRGKISYDLALRSYFFKAKDKKSNFVNFLTASSSVKALFAFDEIFSESNQNNKRVSVRKKVFIDEPELNLDANAQMELAKLLVQFIQKGHQLIISTHSEIIIRTVQNELLRMHLSNKGTNDDEIVIYNTNEFKKIDIIENSYISNFEAVWEIINDEYNENILNIYDSKVSND